MFLCGPTNLKLQPDLSLVNTLGPLTLFGEKVKALPGPRPIFVYLALIWGRLGRSGAGCAGHFGRELLRELTGERQWAYEQP